MFIEAIKNGAILNTNIALVCGCGDSAARTHLSSLVALGKVRIQNLVHSNKKNICIGKLTRLLRSSISDFQI